jgi:hypothetical protein
VNRKRIIYSDDEILTEEFFNIDWDSLRIERDVALVKCDWRFMSDQSPSQEWIDYREFLRNLPQNHFDESDEVTQGANAAADAWNEYDKPE